MSPISQARAVSKQLNGYQTLLWLMGRAEPFLIQWTLMVEGKISEPHVQCHLPKKNSADTLSIQLYFQQRRVQHAYSRIQQMVFLTKWCSPNGRNNSWN